MVIKTLEYIHKSLLHDKKLADAMCKDSLSHLRKAQDAFDADPTEKNKRLLEEAKELRSDLLEKQREITFVLEDFESKDF
jgi:hypothetical protein